MQYLKVSEYQVVIVLSFEIFSTLIVRALKISLLFVFTGIYYYLEIDNITEGE